MEANSEVRQAYGLEDGEDYGTFDKVSRRVSAMGLFGLYMEVGQVSCAAGFERRCQPRQQGPASRCRCEGRGRRCRGSGIGIGSGAHALLPRFESQLPRSSSRVTRKALAEDTKHLRESNQRRWNDRMPSISSINA